MTEKFKVLSLFGALVLTASPAFAGTRCNVSNGVAIGYVCSESMSGLGTIRVFDEDNRDIGHTSSVIVAVVVSGCKEVIRYSAGDEAVSCSFSIR